MGTAKEILVGAIFLIAIIVLCIFTIIVSDYRPFRAEVLWDVQFTDVRGLKVGDEVRASGLQVGKVKKLALANGGVLVTMRLYKPLNYYSTGRITIENVTPLGGKFINIDTGHPPAAAADITKALVGETPPEDIATSLNKLVKDIREGQGTFAMLIRDGAVYKDIKNITGTLSNFADDVKDGKGFVGRLASADSEKIYADIEAVVASVRAASDQISDKKGTVGKLIYDDALYVQLDQASKSIQEITADLRAGKGTVGKLLTDEKLYNDIRDITDSINSGKGVIGKLVKDEQMGKDLAALVVNLNAIAASIQNGEGTIGALVKDKRLYDEAVKTVTSIRSITEKIASGEGTVGKLIYDQTLYTKIDRLVMELTEATEDVREAAPITAFATLLLAGFR